MRNSENTVVQFTYGDDSLDPEKMENNDRPVQFDRLHLHISQIYPCSEEPYLLKDDLLNKVQRSLGENRFQLILPKGRTFLSEIESFFEDIVKKQVETIESCENDAMIQQRTWNSCRFTDTQVNEFLKSALTKYTKGLSHARLLLSEFFSIDLFLIPPPLNLINFLLSAMVEPGEAVGAMGAQSISEPGTQMTLKVRLCVCSHVQAII